jgi:hypothetical protein
LETISSFSKNDYINRKLAPKQFDRHNFLWRMATFQPNVRWAEPSPCHSGSGEQDGIESVLTNEQVDSWRNRGFALVNGVIPEDLLVAVKADAAAMFPPPGSQEAEKLRDFGSGGRMDFPCPESDAFNRVIVHHRLLKCLSQLLDVDVMDLRLTQGELWPKYGSERSGVADDNTDQRMHCDYPNHTLAHPSEWENPEAVEMILYLNNVEECGGATAVVPREGPEDKGYQWPICQMPGFGSLVWHNDMTLAEQYLRESSPEVAQFRAQHLYPRESYAKFQFGTILFYRHDTWHRGTPLAPNSHRFVINMTVRRSDATHIMNLHQGWCWKMYTKSMFLERLIAQYSVQQRTVLGFPAPGYRYWTAKTIAAVGSRYGPFGVDMKPYLDALAPAAK